MVKGSSRPHGPQRTVAMGCVLHGHGAHTARAPRGGRGRQAAICLHLPAPRASVSTFPGLPLTHRAFFSFLSPQPLHNRHNEPGYLVYSQSAASSQLQVRHCCSGAHVGRHAERLPRRNSFHSHDSLKELASFILQLGTGRLRELIHAGSPGRSVAELRRKPRSP